jgi:hypothetical protein
MLVDNLLSDIQKYTLWDTEIEHGMAIPLDNWDKKYFIEAIDTLRYLESKTLLLGYSSPPYLHSGCGKYPETWLMRNELISGIREKIDTGFTSHWFQMYPSITSDLKKILHDLEKIKEDGIQFQLNNREKNVAILDGTRTEYVSDISGDLVEYILHFFCRSDVKNKPHFLEFTSIPGDAYQITTKEQDCHIMHLIVSIGEDFDHTVWESTFKLFAEIRTLVGLPPDVEDWEIPPSSPDQINHELFKRIQTGIDEYTLGKRLSPDWTW